MQYRIGISAALITVTLIAATAVVAYAATSSIWQRTEKVTLHDLGFFNPPDTVVATALSADGYTLFVARQQTDAGCRGSANCTNGYTAIHIHTDRDKDGRFSDDTATMQRIILGSGYSSLTSPKKGDGYADIRDMTVNAAGDKLVVNAEIMTYNGSRWVREKGLFVYTVIDGVNHYDSGQVGFTGSKTGTQALPLPSALADTAGLELVDASFGGKLLKTTTTGTDFDISAHLIMNAGNTHQAYFKDGSAPTSVTDGTLFTGGNPKWSGNTATQHWDKQTGNTIPENRYYWLRSSMNITYATGSWIRIKYTNISN